MVAKINLNNLSVDDIINLRRAINFEIKYCSRVISELDSKNKAVAHFKKKKLKLARLRVKLNVAFNKYRESILPF